MYSVGIKAQAKLRKLTIQTSRASGPSTDMTSQLLNKQLMLRRETQIWKFQKEGSKALRILVLSQQNHREMLLQEKRRRASSFPPKVCRWQGLPVYRLRFSLTLSKYQMIKVHSIETQMIISRICYCQEFRHVLRKLSKIGIEEMRKVDFVLFLFITTTQRNYCMNAKENIKSNGVPIVEDQPQSDEGRREINSKQGQKTRNQRGQKPPPLPFEGGSPQNRYHCPHPASNRSVTWLDDRGRWLRHVGARSLF